jgi:GT2 family glycosyltransferase
MSKTDLITGVAGQDAAYPADCDQMVKSGGVNSSADDIFRSAAIVILTWNDCAKTERCLESLQSSGYELGRVVLWDNGSIDGTEDLITQKFPNVIYHRHGTNLGVPSGRNAVASLAIRTLSPSHLMFLDNDMVVSPGFLEALCIPFLTDPLVGQTHAKIRFFNEPLRLQSAGGMVIKFHRGVAIPIGYGEFDSGQYDIPCSCIPSGGATLVAVKIFSTFGGFDPIFDPYGFEDIEFSLRVKSAGIKSIYVPQAVVLHDKIYSRKEGLSHSDVFTLLKNWMVVLRRYATRRQRVGFWLFGVPARIIGYCYREVMSGNFAAPKSVFLGAITYWNRRHEVSESQPVHSDCQVNDAE